MRSKNAAEFLTQVTQVNPELAQIFNMARSGNPQLVYESLARKFGVDPKWLINQLLE